MGGVGSGAKPKMYAPELVAQVAWLYAAGQTQAEVAQATGQTQKIVWNIMRRHGLTARVAAKRDQTGPANHAWKGDAAGYQACHLRVEQRRGKPMRCGPCGTTDPSLTYDWANLTGNYPDPDDYERMCRSCHRRYDSARRGGDAR